MRSEQNEGVIVGSGWAVSLRSMFPMRSLFVLGSFWLLCTFVFLLNDPSMINSDF